MANTRFKHVFSVDEVTAFKSAPKDVDIVVLERYSSIARSQATVYLVFDNDVHPAVYTSVEEMIADNYGQGD